MLGSDRADFPPRHRRQSCRSLLTDQHLRRILEEAVAPAFGIARRRLWATTRGSPAEALARQVAMYLAHVGCGLTFAEVARLFARDPKTVFHACALIEDRREEAVFDRTLDLIEGVMQLVSPRPV
jgi:chromosomal replication initiation ATPase DnaA